MFSYTARLLDVRTGEFNSLIMEGKKWDSGLQREVDSSISIGINRDHMYLIEDYRKAIGQVISIQVRPALTKNKSIWYSTSGSGHFVVQDTASEVA